jgi:AcrR family transcriptional regulator
MPKILATNLAEHRQLVGDALLDALDALLDEREYDRITLSDIARRAGVARNTIYNYAPDKASLLLAAVRRSTDGIENAVNSITHEDGRSAADRLSAVIGFLMTSFASGTHRVFVLQSQVHTLDVEDRVIATAAIDAVQSHIARVLHEGVESSEFRAIADTALVLTLISGVIAAGVREIALDHDGVTHVVESVTDFILHAVER